MDNFETHQKNVDDEATKGYARNISAGQGNNYDRQLPTKGTRNSMAREDSSDMTALYFKRINI